ncbi:MAG: hypothetical protein M3P30_08175 [Chloroflexota bacterium]|nr:hypothetical protein [Chloroflexota bacterium]
MRAAGVVERGDEAEQGRGDDGKRSYRQRGGDGGASSPRGLIIAQPNLDVAVTAA